MANAPNMFTSKISRAFSLVEPSCRRCHGPPEQGEPSPNLPRSRFSHRVHVAAHPDLACAACHALDARGEPVTALRDHSPCADAGCHDRDFSARAPTTCGVCHVRSEPWREQHADPTPLDLTEFGASFSHLAHLSAGPAPVDAACTRCHRSAPDGRFVPGFGHTSCSGASCHAARPARGGASPPLSRCGGCHVLGLAEAHEQAQLRRRWSTRQRFTHAPHMSEPAAPGRPVACASCHTGAAASRSLDDMIPPRKQSCARCHDGGAAFKLTGHTCGRCHVAPIAAP